jgi:hypothetical protein
MVVDLFVPGSYKAVWAALGVLSMPTFVDLQVILASWEASRAGLDPHFSNPTDPWGRLINYPPIWQAGSITGWGLDQTVPLALAIIALYLLSLRRLFSDVDRRREWIVGLLLVSPPVLLGVERCNNDLLLFAALVFLLPLEKVRFWFLGAAAVLKIYPAFALLTAKVRQRWAAGVLTGAILVGYFLWTREMIKLCMLLTPFPLVHSYGGKVLFCRLALVFNAKFGTSFEMGDINLIYGVVAVVTTALVVAYALRRSDVGPDLYFLAGGSIFLGTFLFNANYSYRLVFLLLLLPAMMRWTVPEQRCGFGLLLLVFWMDRFSRVPFVGEVGQLFSWAVYVWVLCWMIRMLKAKSGNDFTRLERDDSGSAR